ncbi:uncharacterized protein LOC106866785 isoform X2 [Brachypodium distachyon]|uniref:Uncharacterized protein n=1 Tax=Brachypodium distachyon TaxID=15368 RepID=A0A2K2CKQ7_BRADI|nr:uncharacterized protein LOC106866785 isoform X2 [Brachypodium distachyon]PNT62612.1 hypothetical protein BRADI_4g05810v3 [Brachypodium distachyon]|eukprot:XP_024318646.1 uncharacterized protein LOC106866785 isoform X2 [Brachypodium distachyon]
MSPKYRRFSAIPDGQQNAHIYKMCYPTVERFETGMENTYRENWQEEHPKLDGSIIYETTVKMPHGRLGIANEAFNKIDKSIIKSTSIKVPRPVECGTNELEWRRLENENRHQRQDNKKMRCMEHVLRNLGSDRGLDFDGLMEEAEHEYDNSDPEYLYRDDNDDGTEPGTGSRNGGGGEDGTGGGADDGDFLDFLDEDGAN